MLEIRHVVKTYGKNIAAVTDVSLSVDIVKKPQAIRSRLGFLPQDFGVYPHLSALDFMQYFAALKDVGDSACILHLREIANWHDHAHRPAAAFSGGMRRRLGIAQALR